MNNLTNMPAPVAGQASVAGTPWGDGMTDEAFADSIHAAALEYVSRGLHVFPVKRAILSDPDSGKKPATAHGHKDASADPSVINAWFGPGGTHRGCNVSMACEPSERVVLDADVSGDKQGMVSFNALYAQEPGLVSGAVGVITGSGGRHVYYLARQGEPTKGGNGMWPGLGIKAAGGYVVMPPSRHYSGGSYRWREANPDAGLLAYPAMPTAVVPDIIHRARRAESKQPATLLNGNAAAALPLAGTVEAAMAALLGSGTTGTASEPLSMAGASMELQVACNKIACAPNGQQNDTLNRESYRIGQLYGAGLIQIDEAMPALVNAGIGMVSHDPAQQWTPEHIKSIVHRSLRDGFDKPFNGVHPLEPPYELVCEGTPCERFPVETLPQWLQDVAGAISRKSQCAPVMAVQAAIAASSTAGMMLAMVIRPGSDSAHPCSLLLAVAVESGERKTEAARLAFGGVKDHERERIGQYLRNRQAYDTAIKDRERAVRELDRKSLTPQERAARMASLGPFPVRPRHPAIVSEEPTVAALEKSWELGWPGQSIVTTEGVKLLSGYDMCGTGKAGMATTFSNAHDGSEIRRNRAKDGEPIVLYDRALAMFLAFQPNYLSKLMDPELEEQGLLSRMLIVRPPSMAGSRTVEEVNPLDLEAWRDSLTIREFNGRIKALLATVAPLHEGGGLQRTTLHLSPEAATLWREACNTFEARRAKGGEYGAIRGFASKMAELAMRIGGILHIHEHGPSGQIGAEAMRSAIGLVEWFATERLRLRDEGTVETQVTEAQALLEWMMKQPGEFITRREIGRDAPNRFRRKAQMDKTLTILFAHNQLREVKVRGGARFFIPAKAQRKLASLGS